MSSHLAALPAGQTVPVSCLAEQLGTLNRVARRRGACIVQTEYGPDGVCLLTIRKERA
ncbi:MAG TPA: hypothetical protein VJ934_02620 [Desulfomicrobiaceae bacterium]|nr:hypothetical protein [Desulfomicrobiaceae bacterium]